MASSIEAVLAALNEANVRYLVVGGVAVVLHGHLRTTADLDLVVQLEPENARRALAALATLDYRPRAPVQAQQFADPAIRESWIKDKGLTVFSLWSSRLEDLEVDLFVREPFDFDAAYARAVRAVLDTTTADVAALSDLIALKRAAGRTQDLADIEALERLSSDARMTERPLRPDLTSPPPVADAPQDHQERGRSLSPAARLRWLEQAKRDFGRLLGRANASTQAPAAKSR